MYYVFAFVYYVYIYICTHALARIYYSYGSLMLNPLQVELHRSPCRWRWRRWRHISWWQQPLLGKSQLFPFSVTRCREKHGPFLPGLDQFPPASGGWIPDRIAGEDIDVVEPCTKFTTLVTNVTICAQMREANSENSCCVHPQCSTLIISWQ